MLVKGKTSPTILCAGETSPIRLCNSGEAAIVKEHSRYQEAVSRGNCYYSWVSNVSLMAVGNQISLYNPFMSQVYLSLLNVSAIVTSTAGGPFWAFLQGYFTQNQAAPTATRENLNGVFNCALGGSNRASGFCFDQATYSGTLITLHSLYQNEQAFGANDTFGSFDVDFGGLILLPPNTAITIKSYNNDHKTSVTLTWEEIPIVQVA